jgi:hypothetical protein
VIGSAGQVGGNFVLRQVLSGVRRPFVSLFCMGVQVKERELKRGTIFNAKSMETKLIQRRFSAYFFGQKLKEE